jgi:hypothetical protein
MMLYVALVAALAREFSFLARKLLPGGDFPGKRFSLAVCNMLLCLLMGYWSDKIFHFDPRHPEGADSMVQAEVSFYTFSLLLVWICFMTSRMAARKLPASFQLCFSVLLGFLSTPGMKIADFGF